MPVSRFTIKLIGFDEHETECFLAVFDLAESRLKHQWQIVRTDNADFFLFLAGPLQKNIPNVPGNRCLFYATENLSPRHILVNEGNVPSLRSVVEVLNRVGALPLDEEQPLQEETKPEAVEELKVAQASETEQAQESDKATILPFEGRPQKDNKPELLDGREARHLFQTVGQPESIPLPEERPEPIGQADVSPAIASVSDAPVESAYGSPALQPTPSPVSAPDKPSDDRHVFYPNQGLLKELLAAKSALTWIVINDEVDLWLDPEKGHYYSWANLEQFAPFCSPSTPLKVKAITHEALQKSIEKYELTAHALNNLVWYIAFKASQGRLLEGNSPYDIAHLSVWPNLRLPEGRSFIKLAAFMHSNSVPLIDIAKTTQTPLAQVFDFYNACYLIGLVEKGRPLHVHEKHIDLERQGLLQKIRDRLKL